MSKIQELRLEYACADTASLSLAPPTYPAALDQYIMGYIGTTANGYGVVPVSSTGAAVVLYGVPVGANMFIICDPANTTLCGVAIATGAVFASGPQGIVSVPGNLVTATPSIGAYSIAFALSTTTAFAAQVVWTV